MRYITVAICCVFLFFTENGCKKTTVQTDNLTGKWNIVSDSTSTDENCNGCSNSSNYLGGESDYYNFTDKGTVYISESGYTDTATYTTTTDNQINIVADYFVNGGGVFNYSLGFAGASLPLSYPIKNLTFSVSNMTEHTLTLTTLGTAAFTGYGTDPIKYIEIINLKRLFR